MKFNLKALSVAGLAAMALLSSSLVMGSAAQADGGRREHMLEQLDLTEAQAAQVEAIREEAKAEVQSVLTAEQQAALANSEEQGRRAFRQLDLSEAQRDQLSAIREAAQEDVRAVLTDEQLAQLDTLRSERQSRRGMRQERRGMQ